MAAAVITLKTPTLLPVVTGPLRIVYGTYKFSSSYATGGEAISPAADLRLPPECTVYSFTAQPVSGVVFEWDGTNNKLKANVAAAVYTGTLDVASRAGVSAADESLTLSGVAATDVVLNVQAPAAFLAGLGIQSARVASGNTVTVRNNNASAGVLDGASGTFTGLVAAANGALHEVPSTTDLSGITTKFYCVAAV